MLPGLLLHSQTATGRPGCWPAATAATFGAARHPRPRPERDRQTDCRPPLDCRPQPEQHLSSSTTTRPAAERPRRLRKQHGLTNRTGTQTTIRSDRLATGLSVRQRVTRKSSPAPSDRLPGPFLPGPSRSRFSKQVAAPRLVPLLPDGVSVSRAAEQTLPQAACSNEGRAAGAMASLAFGHAFDLGRIASASRYPVRPDLRCRA